MIFASGFFHLLNAAFRADPSHPPPTQAILPPPQAVDSGKVFKEKSCGTVPLGKNYVYKYSP